MVTVEQIELNKSESEQVLELLQIGFNEKFSLDWLFWKYINNPLLKGNKPMVYAAIDNSSNKIVGLISYIPYQININGEIINAAQQCDIVVHPNYRNKGVFTLLIIESTKQLKNYGIKLIFVFPNFNSMPGLLKQDFKKVGLLDESYCFNKFSQIVSFRTDNLLLKLTSKLFDFILPSVHKIIKNVEKHGNKDITITIEKEFTEEYCKLSALNKNKISVGRTLEYLNWRYKERPDKEYTIWAARRNNNLEAYLITNMSYTGSLKEGKIIDFHYSNLEDFFTLLKTVMERFIYDEKCNFISTWAFTEKELTSVLNKAGFIFKSKFPFKFFLTKRQLMVKVLDSSISENVLKIQNWSLRASDKDIY